MSTVSRVTRVPSRNPKSSASHVDFVYGYSFGWYFPKWLFSQIAYINVDLPSLDVTKLGSIKIETNILSREVLSWSILQICASHSVLSKSRGKRVWDTIGFSITRGSSFTVMLMYDLEEFVICWKLPTTDGCTVTCAEILRVVMPRSHYHALGCFNALRTPLMLCVQ